jgi:SET family sugar efflux transporter-like MFS transporter
VLLVGVAEALSQTYIVLYGVDVLRLSALQVGVCYTASGVTGMLAAIWCGRRFDRRPTRRWLIGVVLAGAAGWVLLSQVRSFAAVLLLCLTLIGVLTGAGFPQLFALARARLPGDRTARALRTVWSAAWTLGPALAAAVVAWRGYVAVFGLAAAMLVLAAVTVSGSGRPQPPAPSTTGDDREPPPAVPRAALILVLGGASLFFLAMFAGGLALPLYLTRTLGRPDSFVGVMFSVTAGFEVLASLVVTVLPARVPTRSVVLAGMVLMVAYFGCLVFAHSSLALVLVHALRGAAIAGVGAAGLHYLQQLLAPAVGRASSLYANSATAAGIVSGLVGGTVVTVLGARAALASSAGIAMLAVLLFWVGSRQVDTDRGARIR